MKTDFEQIQLADLRARHPGVFDDAQYVGVGSGWLPLLEDFLLSGVKEIHELKEKFGALRIYCNADDADVRLAQILAEERSAHRCEMCGQPGFVRRPPPPSWSWWKCRCDEHASPDQLAWPRHPSVDVQSLRQSSGHWYRYDPAADELLEVEPPERWKR